MFRFIPPGPDPANIIQQGLILPFKLTCRFPKGVVTRFNITNGGTVADIVDNSFHLLINSTSIILGPTISYQVRVMYTDA